MTVLLYVTVFARQRFQKEGIKADEDKLWYGQIKGSGQNVTKNLFGDCVLLLNLFRGKHFDHKQISIARWVDSFNNPRFG